MYLGKRGFTLIEIIVCVAILSIVSIGTILIVTNNDGTDLNKITNKILESANLFVSIEKDIDGNIYRDEILDDRKGIKIPLKTLVNKGYVSDEDAKEIYDKKSSLLTEDAKDFYVLFLAGSGEENDYCEIGQITSIASWMEEEGPVYLCNKLLGTSKNEISNGYIAKGFDANNWVKFDVVPNKNDWVYFPNDGEEDLWRIISISDSGEIKLIYNKNVSVNNKKNINYNMEACNDSGKCKLNIESIYKVCSDSYYWLLMDDDKLSLSGIFEETSENQIYSPKYYIYDAIVNKNYVKKGTFKNNVYYISLSGTNVEASLDLRYVIRQKDSSYEDYIGNITLNEIRNSFDGFDTTYIPSTIFAYGGNFSDSNDKKSKLTYISLNENGDYERIYYSNQNFYCGSDEAEKFYSYYYSPVVILNTSVKIKNYSNCSDGSIRGSKECPYELILNESL